MLTVTRPRVLLTRTLGVNVIRIQSEGSPPGVLLTRRCFAYANLVCKQPFSLLFPPFQSFPPFLPSPLFPVFILVLSLSRSLHLSLSASGPRGRGPGRGESGNNDCSSSAGGGGLDPPMVHHIIHAHIPIFTLHSLLATPHAHHAPPCPTRHAPSHPSFGTFHHEEAGQTVAQGASRSPILEAQRK